MITSNVARRYARAFFDVAGQENRWEDYYRELGLFSAVLVENGNLKELLQNPVFKKEDKTSIVERILEMLDISTTTANFLRLLVDKGRIGSMAEIEEDYRRLMDRSLGISRVQVNTAFPLTAELTSSLKQCLESLTGRKIEMQVNEDPSLIGGIVVRIGDKLYDGSIRMQLNNMMKLLGEET